MAWDEARAWLTGKDSKALYQSLLDDATTALLDAMNRENEAEINAAKKRLVTEMRKALGVRY